MAIETTKKQFKYRGKTMEELQQLDTREFAKIICSRNRRTILRNFQKIENFLNRAKEKIKKGKQVRTHRRDLIIIPEMVGMRISIYNGQKFIPVDVTGDMLGHKFGEFASSRQRITHGKAGVGATKGSKHKSKK